MSELEIWNELGNLYYNTGSYDEAVRAYSKAIELDQGCVRSYDNLASIYLKKERYTEVIPLLLKGVQVLKDVKEKAVLWNRVGEAYLLLDDYENASAAYRQAAEFDPENAAIQDNLEKAGLELVREDLPSEDGPEPSTSAAAEEPPLAENPVEAVEPAAPEQNEETGNACWVFNADKPASPADPDLPGAEPAPVLLGGPVLLDTSVEETANDRNDSPTADSSGEDAGADPTENSPIEVIGESPADLSSSPALAPQADLAEVGEASPARANAFLQAGILQWRKGELEEASRSLNLALRIASSLFDTQTEALCLNALGMVAADQGQVDLSIQDLESAASLAPDTIFPWNRIGCLYSKVDRYEKAMTAFQKAIEHNPKDALSWNGLGDVYHKLGRNDDAIAAYQLANVFDKQGHEEDAVTRYETTFDADQKDPQVWIELGNIHRLSGTLEETVCDYQKALEYLTADAEKAFLWKQLGDVYQELNDPTLAEAAYRNAAELDPETPGPLEALPKDDEDPAPLPAKEAAAVQETIDEFGIDPLNLSAEPAEATPATEDPAAEAEPAPEMNFDSESAYWVFDQAEKPLTEAPRSSTRFHVSAFDTAAVREKPAPKLPLSHFSGQVMLDDHSPTGMEEKATVIMVDDPAESPEVEEQDEELLPFDQPGLPTPPPVSLGAPVANPSQADFRVLENDIAAYRRVTEINPKNDRAWDALGNMYEAVGLHTEAIAAFEQAISLDPRKEVYYYHLGLAHASQLHYDKAIHSLKMVVELNPEYMLAHCALAGYYRRLGKEAEAQEHISIARSSIENENEYNQACFESISGNADRAIALLKIALEKQQIQVEWVRNDQDLDFVRTDPRFEALVHKYGTAG